MIKLVSFIWVGLTVLINIFALSGLLGSFGIAETSWQGPLAQLSGLYSMVATPIYGAASGALADMTSFELPSWSIHALLAYAASASAVAVSGMGITSRSDLIDSVKSSGMGLAWPVGIVFLIWKAIRFQIVTKFVRDHGAIFLVYIALVVGGYFGAAHLNGQFTEPPAPVVEVTEAE